MRSEASPATVGVCAGFIGISLFALWLSGGTGHPPSDVIAHVQGHKRNDVQQAFLFVGILSGRDYAARRNACRAAWIREQDPALVSAKFFIAAEGEVKAESQAEIKKYSPDDIVQIPGEFSYDSIGILALAMFEYALEHYDASFILKTDDDSFIVVPALLMYLRGTCENPSCCHERSYIGWEEPATVRHGQHHKHRHEEFWDQTGLQSYPKFMRGGGYIISPDAARLMLEVVRLSETIIFNTSVEDAAIGFYMSFLRLRRFHSPRFWVSDPVKYNNMTEGFPRNELARRSICGKEPPLVVHNMKDPKDMHYIGDMYRNCSTNTA